MDDNRPELPSFGQLLASLRRARKQSQLSLALTAEISTRHLSFLETGRSDPTRQMVARLASALELPQADRHALMCAAGFWEPSARMVGADAIGRGHSQDDLDAVIAIEASSEPQKALSIAADRLAAIGLVQYYIFRARFSADRMSLKLTPQNLDYAPLGWILHCREHDYRPVAPLIRATARLSRPFFWREFLVPSKVGGDVARRVLGESAAFRIGDGFMVPLYRPDGCVYALSAMAEKIDSADPATRATAKAVSVALLHRLDEMGLPKDNASLRLDDRERDLLLRVLDGRSARTTSNKSSGPAGDDVRVLNDLCARFGTVEPLEAALRARRAGVLDV